MFKSKVVLYSGSRADYFLIQRLIKNLRLKTKAVLFVGPHHFSSEFGNSFKLIEKSKDLVIEKIEIKSNYLNLDFSKFTAETLIKYQNKLIKHKPSIAIVLGDRYELLGFALACNFLKIRLCHIHGGEITVGSFDDTTRHVVSKLSNYHFVSNNTHKKRLISMGEDSSTIYNFGSLGAEKARVDAIFNKKNLIKKLKIKNEKRIILATFHPETNSAMHYEKQIDIFLKALIIYGKSVNIIFTASNSDPGGIFFNKKIKQFCNEKGKFRYFFKNLGSKIFSSLLKHSDLIIGNSSSGIIEAPTNNKYILNIGKRQLGREKNLNVIDCKLEIKEIRKKIKKFLNKKKIRVKNIYYKKNCSLKMSKKIIELSKLKTNSLKYFNE